ncbi:hypothetical protein ACULNC_14095 [Shigella flexneri]
MMVMSPLSAQDALGADAACRKTGGGLTSLSANEATLSARIERTMEARQGELPEASGYVFACWRIARQAPWRGFALLRWRLGSTIPRTALASARWFTPQKS